MGTKVVAVAAIRLVRRATGSLSPVALVAVVLALIFGGVGAASAATGRAFILGGANSETTTANLGDSHGTPLSLVAPKGRAPLTVNRTAQVKNLNVQYVGGLNAATARPTGGDGTSGLDNAIPADAAVAVAETGNLSAGVYYVTATADLNINGSGATGATCQLVVNTDDTGVLQQGGATGTGHITVAETVAVSVHSNNALVEICSTTGVGTAAVVSSGIVAIRVQSSSGTAPAVAGS